MSIKARRYELKYGRIAYNAYCDFRGWKTVRGEPLPSFTERSLELQSAWEAAAVAVLRTAIAEVKVANTAKKA